MILMISIFVVFGGVSFAGPVSEHQLELLSFSVNVPSPTYVNSPIEVRFTLKNVSNQSIQFSPVYGVFVGARCYTATQEKEKDFGHQYKGTVINPGQSITFTATKNLDAVGTWMIWPAYNVNGQWGPYKWNANYIEVLSKPVGSWDSSTQTFNPASGSVVLYDSSSCRGEPYVVFSQDTPDFGQWQWHDRASCITVGPYTKTTVYEHGNYGGWSRIFVAGSSAQTYPLRSCMDNKISSIKIINASSSDYYLYTPTSYQVALYDSPECIGMPYLALDEGSYNDSEVGQYLLAENGMTGLVVC